MLAAPAFLPPAPPPRLLPSAPRRTRLAAPPPRIAPSHRRAVATPRASARNDPHPTRQLDRLVTWCQSSGVRLDNVAILEQNNQRGLFATRDIAPGDEIIAIPRAASIIADTESPAPPPLRYLSGIDPAFWQTAAWEVRLAVQLLDECLDEHSPYRPYLDALPTDPACVLWAYETAGRARVADQLRPYDMHNVADATRAHSKSTFVNLRKALPQKSRHLVTLRSFSWAVAVAITRGFGIPRSGESHSHLSQPSVPTLKQQSPFAPVEYALFPGLDMTNCSVHCKTSFKYDAEADLYRVSTGASFARGEQVFVSYGSKSNDDFMFFYGFVEGSNPANKVKIPNFRMWVLDLAYDHASDSHDWDRKLQLLLEEKLTHSDKAYEFQLDTVDEDLMFVLRVALASEHELEGLREKLEREPGNGSRTISLQNELAVWKAIENKCTTMLEDLGGFDAAEQQRLTQLFSVRPCTAAWVWGERGSDGELLYRYERQMVLSSTMERVRHFASTSSAVGRICTVLVPPSQSLLRAEVFGSMSSDEDTSGVYRFNISPQDLQTQLGGDIT